jgi:DNA-binding NarL/FixJ family response regulator
LIAHDDVRAARELVVAQLAALEPGAFVPPTVAVAAARSLDALQLVLLRDAASAYGASTSHRVARATSDLVLAIVATRLGNADRARAASAAAAFRAAGWPLFEATALAYAGHGSESVAPGKRAAVAESNARLTAREWQVATLVAAGNSNVEIGRQLDVGIKTVEKHVSSALLKLGARSRAQIATFVATRARDGR